MIALAAYQARTLLRGRATIAAIVIFALVAGLATLLGLGSYRQLGLGSVGPAAAALINLAVLLPTAQAILLGSLVYAGDRESGFAAMLRARGTGVPALVVTTWLAVTLSAWLSLLAGFGLAAVIIAGNVPLADLATFVLLAGLMLLVAASAAAIGVLVGVVAGTRVQAALAAVAMWFVLSIGLDLAVVGLGAYLRFGEAAIIGAIVIDPLTTARIAALGLLDANGSVLGPVGAYLLDRIGRAGTLVGLLSVILAWTAVPLGVAIAVQRRRDL